MVERGLPPLLRCSMAMAGESPFDEIHVRLLHLIEELPRIRGQALDIAPLALGIERVEGERRLAGAAQPGDDDQLLARDFQREVFEVVLARANDADEVGGHLGRKVVTDHQSRRAARGEAQCERSSRAGGIRLPCPALCCLRSRRGPSISQQNPARAMSVAAISCKQLGDTLLLQPALASLAARDGAPVALHTRTAFAPLIELMPGARLPERGVRCEQLWVFEHGSKAARRALFMRAREKCAVLLHEKYRRWFHRFVFSRIEIVPKRYGYRACDFFCAVGGGGDFQPPALREPPAGWLPEAELPGEFVVIGPTAAWESKCWTPEQWARTADALAERLPVVMVGGGSEWERRHVAEIRARVRAPLCDLAGRTSLRELFAIIARARAVVAIDGAVAHVAAALRRPSLALFGPTRSEEWHWPMPISHVARAVDHCAEKRPPLSRLPESAVIPAALRLLDSAN